MRSLIKIFSCFLVAVLIAALPMAAQTAATTANAQKATPSITGDWQGTLSVSGQELHLILHIAQTANGAFKATLDSVDQNANGIPITSMSLKEGKLVFTVDAVRGSYEGKLNAGATLIEGTWSQGQPLPLTFKRAVKKADIDGDWLGTLEVGGAKLRLQFHITSTPEGFHATVDSLDQGAMAMPASAVTRGGSKLQVELKQINGSFSGTIDKDLTTIDGSWNQNGASAALVLKRVTNPTKELAMPVRPQDPVKPYPYHEEDVVYDNKSAGNKLAATLTLPQGKGPFPAVVLITGSGPQDRDESLLGHRPFLVLADYLTRKGIVVLRADDRGIGKSTGTFATATTTDFATDAEAGIAYLKTRPEVNAHKIGLIGHSEGGIIAPMVAARNHDVAFIVMMAGSGVPGDEIIVEQLRLIMEAGGAPHDAAEKQAATEREILALVKQESDSAALEKKLRDKLAGTVPEAQVGAAIRQVNTPWMRYFISYDPAIALRQVTCPTLAINGEKDLQVPPKQNLPAIRKALETAGNKNAEVDELPGLNHLFQTATTGSPNEYAQISETISPVALEKITDWIVKQQ